VDRLFHAARILGLGDDRHLRQSPAPEVVFTSPQTRQALQFDFSEPESTPGRSVYYVRVVQADGEMAWGSPVWVTYER
jgi:hypothetical protein